MGLLSPTSATLAPWEVMDTLNYQICLKLPIGYTRTSTSSLTYAFPQLASVSTRIRELLQSALP